MLKTRLIFLDGIPGSGKSTLSRWLSETLDAADIPHILYREQQERHPLRIYDPIYTDFTDRDQSKDFRLRTIKLYRSFVETHLNDPRPSIVDGWLFGATIGFTCSFRMDWSDSAEFAFELMEMLMALEPSVIYIAQEDVEYNWRRTCTERGDAWVKKFCGFTTDFDYVKAGTTWSAIQAYCLAFIRKWQVPKLVIWNSEYDWESHRRRIASFLEM